MSGLVVYGGAGFVASALLKGTSLPASQLTLVDPAPIDRSVLSTLSAAGLSADIIRSSSLADIDAVEAEALLVFAGQTDVDEALRDPALAFRANTAIAIDAAEWWRQHQGVRLVYLSSDEVLGVSSTPLNEMAPLRPTQPYAASKAAAEITLHCYSESYGLDLVIIRSCNLVGSRQRARKLIPTAVAQLAAGQPVPIFGDGLHQREYLAVDDLCAAISLAVNHALPAGTYNCTSEVALRTIEVVEIIAKALGVKPIKVRVDDRLIHDRCYAMDASKLHTYGWKPNIAPHDAIASAALDMKSAWNRGEPLTHRSP